MAQTMKQSVQQIVPNEKLKMMNNNESTLSCSLEKRKNMTSDQKQYDIKQNSQEDELDLLTQVWSYANSAKQEVDFCHNVCSDQINLSDDDSLSFEQFQYRVVCPDNQNIQNSNEKLNEISEIFQQVEYGQEDSFLNEQYNNQILLDEWNGVDNQILSSLSLNSKYRGEQLTQQQQLQQQQQQQQFYFNQQQNNNNYWISPQQSNHYNFVIHPDEILKDKRTTLMMKNIPSNYSVYELVQEVDQLFKNKYDFIYMPYDQIRKNNVGYAFINLLNPQYVKEFYHKFYWRKWKLNNQDKINHKLENSQHCTLRYARVQGSRSMMTQLQADSQHQQL